MHEAKVDIVTVPNLSEHLSNAATTAQLSSRFAYAAAMKSINNLLLLGDGESWARQKVDFAGLPEMVRTFLQVAAGAADIPVTRLLGQSPAGLSATGDSDTRNYYDMISARQELDLRPQLERLDAVLLRSAGVDPARVGFEFRPLWQLDAAQKAQVALTKAQTTAVYAGLNLWPAETTAGLVRGQLLEDGTYPGAAGVLGAHSANPDLGVHAITDYDPNQSRDPQGRWTAGGGSAVSNTSEGSSGADPKAAQNTRPNETSTSLSSNFFNVLNPISTASARAIDPTMAKRGPAENSRNFNTIVAQANGGPFLPGKPVEEPILGTDPLDPAGLNTSTPSVEEQLALTATLNLIQTGATQGLKPHPYKNYPDLKTGAVLPASASGYVATMFLLGDQIGER